MDTCPSHLQTAQAVTADGTLTGVDQATVNAAVAALSDAMNGLTAGGAPETTDKPEASQAPEATDKPQTTQKPESNVPQTGDNAQLGLMFSILVLSAAGMGAVVTLRRRRG